MPLRSALQTNQAVIGLVCVPDVFKAADSESNFRYVSCQGCEAFNNIIHDPHITSGSFLNTIVRPPLAPECLLQAGSPLKLGDGFKPLLPLWSEEGEGEGEKGKRGREGKGARRGEKGHVQG